MKMRYWFMNPPGVQGSSIANFFGFLSLPVFIGILIQLIVSYLPGPEPDDLDGWINFMCFIMGGCR